MSGKLAILWSFLSGVFTLTAIPIKRRSFLLCIIFLLFGGTGPTQGRILEPLSLGYSSVSGNRAPLWIAKDVGLFEKYGLDVKLVFIRAGSTATQALIGGDIQMVAAAGSAAISAAARGAPIVIIATVGADSI
jgi:ABC-type nitrate/sulfonate/bicarbonate transport system substrate-binding protein